MKSETRSKKNVLFSNNQSCKKEKNNNGDKMSTHTHTHTILFILAVKNYVVGRSCRIISVEGGEYYIYSSA